MECDPRRWLGVECVHILAWRSGLGRLAHIHPWRWASSGDGQGANRAAGIASSSIRWIVLLSFMLNIYTRIAPLAV